MKKQIFHKAASIATRFVALVILAFSVVAVFAPEATDSLLAFFGSAEGAGATVATTIIAANTRETVTAARPRSATDPGHLIDDVSRVVTMIKPDDFTLDTVLRSMESSEKAEDLIVNFEEVQFRGSSDSVTVALAAPGGVTEADRFRDITVGNPGLWTIGESIYVPGVLVSGRPLQLRVDNINANGTLNVTSINSANNVVPAIPINTPILRGASAFGELRARAENKTLVPANRNNYCQRHLAQVEEGFIRGMIDSKSGFGIQDQNFIRMYDFRNEMEKASIFGVKAIVPSRFEKENIYYQEGVYHQLTQELTYTAVGGITQSTWIDWTKDVFAGNSGAEDRMLFAGRDLMATILKIPAVEKQLEAGRVEIVPGVKIVKIETSFGMLYLKHHKLFDTMGHVNDGMVVDLTNIKRRPFLALNQRPLKLRESGISNVNATLIEEIFCLETRYLDTHARIRRV